MARLYLSGIVPVARVSRFQALILLAINGSDLISPMGSHRHRAKPLAYSHAWCRSPKDRHKAQRRDGTSHGTDSANTSHIGVRT
jgi:hypothetical protein